MQKSSSICLVALMMLGLRCTPNQAGAEPPAQPLATAPAPSAEAEGSAPPAAAPAATPPAAGAINWDAMTHEQRLEHMKTVVMPKMKELFVSFDAKEFGSMKCPTCHGDGAKPGGDFEMPNPKLPKLSFTGGFKKHLDHDPAITKFMMERVVPEMAALIGEPVYDPATNKGFGCGECHEVGP